jgi:ParB-like chromosome segregation protein Spo0J
VTPSATKSDFETVTNEVEKLGFQYIEVAEYDLSQLRSGAGVDPVVQVRELRHYTPKDAIERYSIMMGESVFPPIVVTRDRWIVDGHTRVAARAKRKDKFSPAIVLEMDWENSTAKQRANAHILAATLNANAGTPLTTKEIRLVAEQFIERGVKPEEIARRIGLRASRVAALRREMEATTKLREVGLDNNGGLKGASLRALGARDVMVLTNDPYKELAVLAADAGLNAGEIKRTAQATKEIGTEAGQLDFLAKERGELGDRIHEKSLTGSARPPVARQLRQHLGFVTKFSGRVQELIETDPAVGTTHLEAIDTSIEVLTELRDRQRGDYPEKG